MMEELNISDPKCLCSVLTIAELPWMKLHEAEFQGEKCDERFRFVGGEQCLVPVVKIRTYFRVFCFPVAIPAISFCVLVFCVFHRRSFVEVSSCH